MDNLDDRLQKVPLAKPSAAHDAAMRRVFAEAPLHRPRFWSANVALWQTAAACCACLAFGYLLHAYVEPPPAASLPTSTVYVIPPDPALRGIFDASARQNIPAFDPGRVRVRVLSANDAPTLEREI
ncbi:MAG: hypothetical protein SGI88_16705 [Candidatus Hydrogenedentes bacterium]|nr:hypothetical protein [Candidatus Hydrogenedentota bacterium]